MSETTNASGTTSSIDDLPDLAAEAGGFSFSTPVSVAKSYFEAINTLIDELILEVRQDGLNAVQMDRARVAGIEAGLEPTGFEHYSSTGGRIAVDVKKVLEVLNLGESDDLAEFYLDQDSRKLEIRVAGVRYRMALIDPDIVTGEGGLPDIGSDALATVFGEKFDRGVDAADMVGEHMTLQFDERDDGDARLLFVGDGDTDDVSLEVSGDELLDVAYSSVSTMFSIDYLDDISKAVPDDTEMTLGLSTQEPLHIEYEAFEDGGTPHGTVRFMVAPRLNSS